MNYICISFIFLHQEEPRTLMIQNIYWEKIFLYIFFKFSQYLLAVTVRKEQLGKMDLCSELLWPFLFYGFFFSHYSLWSNLLNVQLTTAFLRCSVPAPLPLLLGISKFQITSFQPKSYLCSSLTPFWHLLFLRGNFQVLQGKKQHFCFIITRSSKQLISHLGFKDEHSTSTASKTLF